VNDLADDRCRTRCLEDHYGLMRSRIGHDEQGFRASGNTLLVYLAILRQCRGYDVDPDVPVFESCHCDGYGALFDEWHQFDEHGLPFLYCMSPVND
jgi:hypothetical protein